MRTSRHARHNDNQALTLGQMRRGFTPLFFDANTFPAPLEGLYYGANAFLVLNGPSVSALPPDFHRGIFTATVNNGPRTVRGNVNVMLDPPFRFSLSQWLDPTVQKIVPISHASVRLFDNRKLDAGQKWEWSGLRVADCPNVFFFRRNDKFDAARFLIERTVNWGSVGGNAVRSVMLSALRILAALGFKQIFIFGADFHMDAEKRYSFPIDQNDASVKGNNRAYPQLDKLLSSLVPHLQKSGISVYNCTAGSRLTAFPALDLQEALSRALEPVGDWRNEKTEGMYDDKAKKSLLSPT